MTRALPVVYGVSIVLLLSLIARLICTNERPAEGVGEDLISDEICKKVTLRRETPLIFFPSDPEWNDPERRTRHKTKIDLNVLGLVCDAKRTGTPLAYLEAHESYLSYIYNPATESLMLELIMDEAFGVGLEDRVTRGHDLTPEQLMPPIDCLGVHFEPLSFSGYTSRLKTLVHVSEVESLEYCECVRGGSLVQIEPPNYGEIEPPGSLP